jgi:hypothetical protein
MKYGNYQPPKPPKKNLGGPTAQQRDEARKRRNMDALKNNPKTAFSYKVPKKKSPKVLTIKKPKAR